MASGWARLPQEVRIQILQTLVHDGCALGPFAVVSREWQTEIERQNFARIKLTPSRLVDFGSMIHRNQTLVNCIWFCLELEDYGCLECAPDRKVLTDEAYVEAFSVNQDISIYSPSDSKHWFPYLTFMPDITSDTPGGGLEQTISNKVYNDPRHGWIAGVQHSAPPRCAVHKVFHAIMDDGPFDTDELELQWWDQLPSVPAVTSILLRQQNHRRWKQRSLAHMFARFPRLQEIHYEPWREWDWMQRHTDRGEYCWHNCPVCYSLPFVSVLHG